MSENDDLIWRIPAPHAAPHAAQGPVRTVLVGPAAPSIDWQARALAAEEHARFVNERWAAAESKLARLEGLERAARYAAAWFREYENLHAAKGTADGDRKALLNADRAERIEAALAYASENGE